MAKNEYNEPEEINVNDTEDAEIVDDFNPLDEPVIEKPYTKPNVRVSAKDLQTEIPEPSFIPPPLGEPMIEDEKVKKVDEPFNKELKDLPKKDKHDAAEKVAKMIMQGYKFVNKLADDSLQISEKKLMKMQREGEIDLSVQIPLSPTEVITAGEFVQEYNSQTKDTISVSKEFEDEAMPLLTEVLAKRGVGMTTEQYLGYIVIKDIAGKGFLMSQSLAAKREILNSLKDAMAMSSPAANAAPPPPPPSSTYTQEPPQQPSYQQPSYDPTNVNDFVNQMVGSVPEPMFEAPQEEMIDEQEEEAPKKEEKVKIILPKNNKSTNTKRGRPKKK